MFTPPASMTRDRKLDAEIARESAYLSALEQLKQGRITQAEAVTALRHAYYRAECHARSMPMNDRAMNNL